MPRACRRARVDRRALERLHPHDEVAHLRRQRSPRGWRCGPFAFTTHGTSITSSVFELRDVAAIQDVERDHGVRVAHDGLNGVERDLVVAGKVRPRRGSSRDIRRCRTRTACSRRCDRRGSARSAPPGRRSPLARSANSSRGEAGDDRASRVTRSAQVGNRALWRLVVEDVFGGQQAQLAQPCRREQRRPVDSGQAAFVLPQRVKLRLARASTPRE